LFGSNALAMAAAIREKPFSPPTKATTVCDAPA
jgi:hypothetical protein